MRLLVQRVKGASVTVDGEVVGAIGAGLLTFLGIHKEDTQADIPWLVKKLAGLRIFTDDAGKMNLSVKDIGGEILVVSQFTLYGDTRQGMRPGFTESAPPEIARPLYLQFVEALREQVEKVETGRFAAMMEVELVNDGPVTLVIDDQKSRLLA